MASLNHNFCISERHIFSPGELDSSGKTGGGFWPRPRGSMRVWNPETPLQSLRVLLAGYILQPPRLLLLARYFTDLLARTMAMKKLLLLSSAIVAAGPALAADLPMKAPPMAAAVPYSWTGCHVGGHIGGAWDRTTYSDPGTFVTPAPPFVFGGLTQNFAPLGASFSGNSDGRFLGGVQAGCDYQFASH